MFPERLGAVGFVVGGHAQHVDLLAATQPVEPVVDGDLVPAGHGLKLTPALSSSRTRSCN